MKPTGEVMQSESKKPSAAKRKPITKTDALEIFSAALATLQSAGVIVETFFDDKLVEVKLRGVTLAQDSEGAYFVPAVDLPASEPQA
jgi:hypothetical protein